MASRPLPGGERGPLFQVEFRREAVLGGERPQLVPCGVLDVDTGLAALDLAYVLDLAGIEHAGAAHGRRCRLEVARELADLLLELLERPEGVDLEDGHEAAVVVAARRLDAEAQAREQA